MLLAGGRGGTWDGILFLFSFNGGVEQGEKKPTSLKKKKLLGDGKLEGGVAKGHIILVMIPSHGCAVCVYIYI